ncbi:glycerol-3-phosphate 1-O-acyltransferase PlsY [Tumebacillus sp. DT12]|uniref:Glycerol-3-phosphate acyltransferase n=1 Tax=Tumebacillus lacus TaxID=2995335 RepID=A0ABT3X2I0_9BACL|nr:glycerol-3-phosphate 1-O-acyltransferase PlsY [Tumebacillus lacus]MCX7569785.1 glycerol-3-phosphate 1-O-acyltransferase PlsY [Tumebacillus lacus]
MTILVLLILSYLIGSIPTALIVGRLGYGVDIREHGSGNLGGTNTFRSLGIAPGVIVSAVDVLKGTLGAALPVLAGVDLHPIFAGIPAVLGHCYPVFAGFRGGKAVATSGGVLLFISPLLFVTGLLVFFLSLYAWKYVSLASMITGVYVHLFAIFTDDKVLSLGTFILCLLVLYRHRSNIERIMNKTETRITWM